MTDPTAPTRYQPAHRRRRNQRRVVAASAAAVIVVAAVVAVVDPFGWRSSNHPKGRVDAADLPIVTSAGGATGATGSSGGTGQATPGQPGGATSGGTAPGVAATGGNTPTTVNALPVLTLTLDGYGGYAVVDARDPVAGALSTQATCRPVPPPAKGACQRQVQYHRGTSVTLHLQTTLGPWPDVSSATGPCNLKWDTTKSPVPPQVCTFTLTESTSVVVTWAAAEGAGAKVTTWDYPTCPVYTHPPRKAPLPCGS